MIASRRLEAFCLLYLYLVWGTSYLANRFVLDGLPPFLAAGSRFFVAGLLMAAVLLPRARSRPGPRETGAALLVGCMLLSIGSGCVVFAQVHVPSSLAAISVASVGIWICVFSRLLGNAVTPLEWLGVALGLLGVVVLNWDSSMQAHPRGAAALLLGPIGWALGSNLSRRWPMPSGAMSTALQMLGGGGLLLFVSLLRHEHWPQTVPWHAGLAWLYLLTFASLVAFSAYTYLLKHVPPSLATSYAYVNPLVAVLLGHFIAQEPVGPNALGGLALILTALLLVARRR